MFTHTHRHRPHRLVLFTQSSWLRLLNESERSAVCAEPNTLRLTGRAGRVTGRGAERGSVVDRLTFYTGLGKVMVQGPSGWRD